MLGKRTVTGPGAVINEHQEFFFVPVNVNFINCRNKSMMKQYFFLSRQALLLCFLLFIMASCSYKNNLTAEKISLSPYYSSQMVFQKDEPLILKGRCSVNGVLAVRIENSLKYVQADKEGNWSVEFPSVDLKGSFNIFIEGAEEQLVLNDVSMGRVWVIIGNGWLTDYNTNYTKKVPSEVHNAKVKYFQPEISMGPGTEGLKGEWKGLKGSNIHLYEQLPRIAGQVMNEGTGETIGIVNIVYPGMHFKDFIEEPIEGQDTLWTRYFELQKSYKTLADNSFKGIERGVLDRKLDDSGWTKTDFPIITYKRWFLKDRIIWWRKKMLLAEKYIKSPLTLNLGTIRGQFNFYFNGVEIDHFNGETKEYKLQVPDSLVRVWANVLSVRMVAGDSLSGFYSEAPVITNADSSLKMNIAEDWKFRAYYEPALPAVVKPEGIRLPIFNNVVKPLEKINAEGLVVCGGLHFYHPGNSKGVKVFLDKVSKGFNAKEKFICLIPNPGITDSIKISGTYSLIRNNQLVAAAQSGYRIINTLDFSNFDEREQFYRSISVRVLNASKELCAE